MKSQLNPFFPIEPKKIFHYFLFFMTNCTKKTPKTCKNPAMVTATLEVRSGISTF